MGDDTAIHSIPRTARLKPIVAFLGIVDRSLAIRNAVESYRYGVDASWMTKYGKTENHGTTEPRNHGTTGPRNHGTYFAFQALPLALLLSLPLPPPLRYLS